MRVPLLLVSVVKSTVTAGQTFDAVAGTVNVGTVLSNVVITAAAVAEQPFAPETRTVNVPAVVTAIVCVVAPVDHKYELKEPASKVVLGTVQFNAKPLLFAIVGIGKKVVVGVKD